LFLILQGGVLVDRTDVRKIIQRTKTLMGISGCLLAALTQFSDLQYWELLVFALVEGVITAFDFPAFSALTVRMVPREDFQQAMALNSTNFHTSRMLGPIVAAWLMAFHGPSLVFLFDGLTYFVVAYVLSRMQAMHGPMSKVTATKGPAMREGLRYLFGSAGLRHRLLQFLLTISCIQPMMIVIFRVFVQRKFNLNAEEFGQVFSFPAMGSMAGALTFAALQPRTPWRLLLIGVPLVVGMLLIMPWMPNLSLTVATMTLAGYGLYLTFSSLTLSMQLDVDDAYRGRLSSVIGMGFSSLGPLMSFPWGHFADLTSPPLAIVSSAGIFAAGSAYLALRNAQKIR
jgi:MFS family permease